MTHITIKKENLALAIQALKTDESELHDEWGGPFNGRDKLRELKDKATKALENELKKSTRNTPAPERTLWVSLSDEDDIIGMARDAFAARYCDLPVSEGRIKALVKAVDAKLRELNEQAKD